MNDGLQGQLTLQAGEKNNDFGIIHVWQTEKLVGVRHKPGKCSAWD
jgi:hypothetical protein